MENEIQQLVELFPHIEKELIELFYQENNKNFTSTLDFLINNTTESKSTTQPDNSSVQRKEETSNDELVAQAIQSILGRNEEPTPELIDKEIRQINTDILIAHEIQFGRQQGRQPTNSNPVERRKPPEQQKPVTQPNTVGNEIVTFFNDIEEGIKSTYLSIADFVESKYEEIKNAESSNEQGDHQEKIPLMEDLDSVELQDLSDTDSATINSLVDLDEEQHHQKPICNLVVRDTVQRQGV